MSHIAILHPDEFVWCSAHPAVLLNRKRPIRTGSDVRYGPVAANGRCVAESTQLSANCRVQGTQDASGAK